MNLPGRVALPRRLADDAHVTDHDALAQLATDAVHAACRVTQAVREALVTPETIQKKDKSPVTVADLAAQVVVAHKLRDTLPLVAEEDAGQLREEPATLAKVTELAGSEVEGLSEDDVLRLLDKGDFAGGAGGRFWCLDPIDGTKGFLRGEHYAVALGLIEDGKPLLGSLGCPALGDGGTVLTATPAGTFSGADKQAVSDASVPAEARLVESVESGHTSQDDSAVIAERLGITREPVRMDSQAKYAAVAMGQADVYLRLPTRPGYEERIWDHAAGAVCVTAAGGRVTDVDGKELDFGQGRTLKHNTGVIATSGKIHDEVVEAVREVLNRG